MLKSEYKKDKYNKTYLMKDEKRDFCLFKVGFATDMKQRIYAYTTHNPMIECISYVNTLAKSEKKIEEQFHDEILKRGYTFINAQIDGKKTEWFKVYYDDPFYNELIEKGLCAFDCGKNRKNQGAFTLEKKLSSAEEIAKWLDL